MIKINDIVKIKNCDSQPQYRVYLYQIGLVIKGPYEDNIRISNDCTMVCLVCDLMVSGTIVPGIPIQDLSRVRPSRLQGAGF